MKTPKALVPARFLAAAMLSAALSSGWICTAEAASRNVVIEFGGPSSVGFTSGDAWTFDTSLCGSDTTDVGSPVIMSCGLSFADSTAAAQTPVKLGFQVKIGSTLYDRVFVSQNGVVTFGNAATSGVTGSLSLPKATIDELAGEINTPSVTHPFVAVLFANLEVPQTNSVDNFGMFTTSGASFYRSVADPIADTVSGLYSIDDAVPALAVTWKKVTSSTDSLGNPTITTDHAVQLVIYRKNKLGTEGDFYLNLRYGEKPADSYDISSGSIFPGVAGFLLGASKVQLDSPVPNAQGHFYTFVDGALVTGTPPPPADGDSDGIPDTTDNCPFIANPGQLDSDGDHFGDACDGDDDGDTVADSADNCPLIANTSQTNSDGDALGNACDSDDDNDGVADTADNCPVVANATQTDSDGDGLGDACDSTPNPVAKRCQVDNDNDVDAHDILAIISALGRRASSPTDPRDADGSGTIQLKDAVLCTAQCTRRLCAVR